MVTSTAPSSTDSPFDTATDATFPSRPAFMAFSIFMASSTMTVSCDDTVSPTLQFTERITPGSGAFTAAPAPAGAALVMTFSPVVVRGAAAGRGSWLQRLLRLLVCFRVQPYKVCR